MSKKRKSSLPAPSNLNRFLEMARRGKRDGANLAERHAANLAFELAAIADVFDRETVEGLIHFVEMIKGTSQAFREFIDANCS